MSVERVWEAPRVTKPYTEEQWTRDREAGPRRSTRSCSRATCASRWAASPRSCRSTIRTARSGTPPRSGPTSAALAVELYGRLKEKYAPQGLAHFGQGKWYPGEPLPRWSLNCFWRRDGEPIWHEPGAARRREAATAASPPTSRGVFLAGVAERLGLSPEYVFAAFEDAFYYLWRERRLPTNVDPFESQARRSVERARLARVFEQGLDAVVGHVLPGRARRDRRALANRAVVPAPRALLPDSGRFAARAIGLPLDSQPWVKKEDYPYTQPAGSDGAAAAALPRARGDPPRSCARREIATPSWPATAHAAASARDGVVAPAERACGADSAD